MLNMRATVSLKLSLVMPHVCVCVCVYVWGGGGERERHVLQIPRHAHGYAAVLRESAFCHSIE